MTLEHVETAALVAELERREALLVAGPDYCVLHAGICEEDAHHCDFAADDDEPSEDGEPRPCELRSLVYLDEELTS